MISLATVLGNTGEMAMTLETDIICLRTPDKMINQDSVGGVLSYLTAENIFEQGWGYGSPQHTTYNHLTDMLHLGHVITLRQFPSLMKTLRCS